MLRKSVPVLSENQKQIIIQTSPSGPRIYRWLRWRPRGCAEISSRTATVASTPAAYIWRLWTGPNRTRASGVRHEFGRTHRGFSLLIRRMRSRKRKSILVALPYSGTSSASKPRSPHDVIAGSSPASPPEPNRVAQGKFGSAKPAGLDHYQTIEAEVALAAKRY